MIGAGFARTIITPKAGLLMGGYRLRREGALDTHDDLYATCAVFRDGQTEIALISLDLLCLPQDVVDRIKERISTRANITPEQTIIACTHTHSGPGTLGLVGENEANNDYLSRLPDMVSALVVAAHKRIRSTQVSILQRDVPDVAFNRRLKLKDGSSAINLDKINPQAIQAAGVTDPCATVLCFESASTTVGFIVNFTLHPTVLGEMNYQYSRDYPGYLVDALSDHLPGQPVGLFFNGAFGNINQIKNPGEWISSFQEAQRIGETIAAHLLDQRSRKTYLNKTALSIKSWRIDIPRRSEIPSRHSYLANMTSSSYDEKEGRSGEAHLSSEKEKLFLLEAQNLLDTTHDLVELQVFQLGEVEIVAIPGELFVELGLEIKGQSDSRYPLIFGNANGYIGYIPMEVSFNEGGYETRLSLTSRLVPKAGEIILASIDQMRKKK